MNNKKAFTLVELIVTIGIIAILGIVGSISLLKVLGNNKEKRAKELNQTLVNAATIYIENELEYPDVGNVEKVYICDLVKQGYLKNDLINPITQEPLVTMSDNHLICDKDTDLYVSCENIDGELSCKSLFLEE